MMDPRTKARMVEGFLLLGLSVVLVLVVVVPVAMQVMESVNAVSEQLSQALEVTR